VVADPRGAPADAAGKAIAGLAGLVTEAPWTLRSGDLTRAAAVGLDEAAVLQVVALSAFFGYLNRVADAVGVELDYEVAVPPPPDPGTPPLPRPAPPDWPFPERAPLSLAARPETFAAAAAWREHALERDAPLSRSRRGLIARTVAQALGDLDGVRQHVVTPRDGLDVAITTFADLLTRSPWRLGAGALEPLRAGGLDDDGIFDVIHTAAWATFSSRTAVALSALGRP
jgi:alkylhydroperoxidase family enzyme